MKNRISVLQLLLATLLFSCAGQKTTDTETTVGAGTQVYCYKDSCENLILSLSLELPVGEDSASLQIRDSLIADFIINTQQPGNDAENVFIVKPYSGDMKNAQAIVDYYGKADYEFLLKLAQADYKERTEWLKEDTTLSMEEKKSIMENVPRWALDLNIKKTTDTLGIVVYQSQAYVYYGGAHGGITGTGALTFDSSTGRKIARFIEPGATKDLQPLIRQGLLKYFCECGDTITDSQLNESLQIEGATIPQPANAEYPNATADSLILTYSQYEIACYAAGMPSITLAVKDIMPYLTPEGKALLNKEGQ